MIGYKYLHKCHLDILYPFTRESRYVSKRVSFGYKVRENGDITIQVRVQHQDEMLFNMISETECSHHLSDKRIEFWNSHQKLMARMYRKAKGKLNEKV